MHGSALRTITLHLMPFLDIPGDSFSYMVSVQVSAVPRVMVFGLFWYEKGYKFQPFWSEIWYHFHFRLALDILFTMNVFTAF